VLDAERFPLCIRVDMIEVYLRLFKLNMCDNYQNAQMTIAIFYLVLTIFLVQCIAECVGKPENDLHTSAKWTLLASKLSAAQVYHVKRAARCRKGQSPPHDTDASRRGRSLSTVSHKTRNKKGLNEWSSWSGTKHSFLTHYPST
jgi:hypothetical protein